MKKTKNYLLCITGAIMFALSVNLFIIPAQIYNGGMVGIAQLLRDAIQYVFKFEFGFDIAGIVNLFLNIPLLVFAWFKFSHSFVRYTLVTIVTQAICFTLIPVLNQPIVDDVFISIIIAAVLGAFGASLSYRAKGSSGGLDVIGFYLSQKKKGSLGSLYLMVNCSIYLVCLIVYNAQTALYSLVYSFIFSFCLDKFHEHNIEVSVMVYTKNKDIKREIIEVIHRGVTYWDGYGAYTGSQMDVFVTIVAQSEVVVLKQLIRKHDPNAFIIVTKNLKVDGGFEKRLI